MERLNGRTVQAESVIMSMQDQRRASNEYLSPYQRYLRSGILSILLLSMFVTEGNIDAYVVCDPPEAVICEFGWCCVLESEMNWRIND